ncbi:hypothetical protein SAMN05421766_102559 [Zobellia uliginosa]|uniref:Transposase n=1 Tax=Zobellia uliginosa TaxID=143224 RepID=A0ABY1KQW6_9FLAO|nr:hypothetical protein SAMN05421766_102559 [Zobellia uliginosa]
MFTWPRFLCKWNGYKRKQALFGGLFLSVLKEQGANLECLAVE